jgi:hypothetical protein
MLTVQLSVSLQSCAVLAQLLTIKWSSRLNAIQCGATEIDNRYDGHLAQRDWLMRFQTTRWFNLGKTGLGRYLQTEEQDLVRAER